MTLGTPRYEPDGSRWTRARLVRQELEARSVVGRGDDFDAAPGVEHQVVIIAGYNGGRSSGESQFKIFVVLWVPAIAAMANHASTRTTQL